MKTTDERRNVVEEVYEKHADGSPALWSERRGDRLYLCDDNGEATVEDLDAEVAAWRKCVLEETEAEAVIQLHQARESCTTAYQALREVDLAVLDALQLDRANAALIALGQLRLVMGK